MYEPISPYYVLRTIWRELGCPLEFDVLCFGESVAYQRIWAHQWLKEGVTCEAPPRAVDWRQALISLVERPFAFVKTPAGENAHNDALQELFGATANPVPPPTFQLLGEAHVLMGSRRVDVEPRPSAIRDRVVVQVGGGGYLEAAVLPILFNCELDPDPSAGDAIVRLRALNGVGDTERTREADDPPSQAVFRLPEASGTAPVRLEIGLARHRGKAEWRVGVRGADGSIRLLHPDADRPAAPPPPEIALIIDRTCADDDWWLPARHFLEEKQASGGGHGEFIEDLTDAWPDRARELRDYRDWNSGLRKAVSDFVATALDARRPLAGRIHLFWSGVIATRNVGDVSDVHWPAAPTGSLTPRTLDPSNARAVDQALEGAAFLPGLNLYAPLQSALLEALEQLDREPSGGARGIIIVGDSPPLPPGNDEMKQKISRTAGEHSLPDARQLEAVAPWRHHLDRARRAGVSVHYVFVKTSRKAVDRWTRGWEVEGGEGHILQPGDLPQTWKDFDQRDEIRSVIAEAIGESLAKSGGSQHLVAGRRDEIGGALDAAVRIIALGPIMSSLKVTSSRRGTIHA
jgi:hypothetical protein